MPVTITWKIENMERDPTDGLVTKVFCRVWGIEDHHVVSYSDSVNLNRGDTFIPYEELTEEIVVSWVKNSLDADSIEQRITQQIEYQKSPPVLSGVPWNN